MPMPAGCLSLCRRYGYAPPRTSPVAPHEPLTPRQKGESSSCIRFHPSLIPARPGPDEKASGRLARRRAAARAARAVVPGCTRSYLSSRRRTQTRAVVPWSPSKVRPGATRYDLAPQGTTWRHKVRPRKIRTRRITGTRPPAPAPSNTKNPFTIMSPTSPQAHENPPHGGAHRERSRVGTIVPGPALCSRPAPLLPAQSPMSREQVNRIDDACRKAMRCAGDDGDVPTEGTTRSEYLLDVLDEIRPTEGRQSPVGVTGTHGACAPVSPRRHASLRAGGRSSRRRRWR